MNKLYQIFETSEIQLKLLHYKRAQLLNINDNGMREIIACI